jgi:hypothetical protein
MHVWLYVYILSYLEPNVLQELLHVTRHVFAHISWNCAHIHLSPYTYMYVFVYVCVCARACLQLRLAAAHHKVCFCCTSMHACMYVCIHREKSLPSLSADLITTELADLITTESADLITTESADLISLESEI